MLTSLVEEAEARGRGEAATVGEETSSAMGRKSATVTALRGVPGSGEDTRRKQGPPGFHSRGQEGEATIGETAGRRTRWLPWLPLLLSSGKNQNRSKSRSLGWVFCGGERIGGGVNSGIERGELGQPGGFL